jgi:hypothetical protein
MAKDKRRAKAMERLHSYRQRNADVAAAKAEYLNEQKLIQFWAGSFYEDEGPCKQTTDRRSEVA